MKCLILGGTLILFSASLLLTLFLPEKAIIFIQCIIMIAAGFILLKK